MQSFNVLFSHFSISPLFCDGKDLKVRFTIIILTFFCLILSSTSVGVTSSHAVQSQEHIVEISGFGFRPRNLEVRSGDVVKWVNKDNRPHQLMAIVEPGWQSRILRRGDTFVQFIGKAVYYVCGLHSNMRGKIVVKGN